MLFFHSQTYPCADCWSDYFQVMQIYSKAIKFKEAQNNAVKQTLQQFYLKANKKFRIRMKLWNRSEAQVEHLERILTTSSHCKERKVRKKEVYYR